MIVEVCILFGTECSSRETKCFTKSAYIARN